MSEKSYSELTKFNTFDERLEYLKLKGVSYESPRGISQAFFKTKRWRQTRDVIARRDLGCDLGILGVYVYGPLYIHHINPITEEDIEQDSYRLYDPENLITTSMDTHNAIHYIAVDSELYVERTPGDTKLW